MKKSSRYLLSGIVFFALMSIANYFLKFTQNFYVIILAALVYVLFNFLSDKFINKKFSKESDESFAELTEEENNRFKKLIERGVPFLHIARKPIVDSWDKCFDSLVSEEAKKSSKHYSDQFRWHLFSFELLPALQGNEAKKAFEKEEKHEIYLFFEYADETYIIGNANLITAEDIDEIFENSSLNDSDMYFFDPLNKWTYIKPHEDELGPYFYKVED